MTANPAARWRPSDAASIHMAAAALTALAHHWLRGAAPGVSLALTLAAAGAAAIALNAATLRRAAAALAHFALTAPFRSGFDLARRRRGARRRSPRLSRPNPDSALQTAGASAMNAPFVMPKTILIADDDPHIREVIRFALAREGWETVEAADGAEALARFAEVEPDLVVLDVGMPEQDGLDVCREIRRTHRTPVLFLSARDEEIDRILGLEIGGDDYVGKPFSPRELTARVKAILKRAEPAQDPEDENLTHGALTLAPGPHEAHFNGLPLKLTPLEFNILATLIRRSDRVVAREDISEAAYKLNVHVSGRTIDSHVRNIRQKLTEAGSGPAIETVHGVGFRIGPCEPDAVA